jgi:hypothetical protein
MRNNAFSVGEVLGLILYSTSSQGVRRLVGHNNADICYVL